MERIKELMRRFEKKADVIFYSLFDQIKKKMEMSISVDEFAELVPKYGRYVDCGLPILWMKENEKNSSRPGAILLDGRVKLGEINLKRGKFSDELKPFFGIRDYIINEALDNLCETIEIVFRNVELIRISIKNLDVKDWNVKIEIKEEKGKGDLDLGEGVEAYEIMDEPELPEGVSMDDINEALSEDEEND